MLTEYETGFTIQETSELTGAALLTDVANKLESILSDEQGDGSPSITESDISASSGYAIIGADRPHPEDPSHTVRIQARLCTEGQAVMAQIRSRFISADDNDPADLTAGPPRVLKEIVNSYACLIGIPGTYRFRREVYLVEDVRTAEHVLSFIKNRNRKIPVLILTEYDNTGRTAIKPQGVFDYLLGLALVVRFRGGTSRHIGKATGRPCYNGSMRFYLPGDSAGKYYSPNDATRNGLTQFQKYFINNAEIHDLNRDFEAKFSDARTRVIRDLEGRDDLPTPLSTRDTIIANNQISLLQHEISSEREAHRHTTGRLKQANEEIDTLRHEKSESDKKYEQTVNDLLERLNIAEVSSNASSDSEKDRKIRLQNTEINQWKRRHRIAEDETRKLKQEITDLTESLERFKVEAAAAKIPATTETASERGLQLTGTAGIDNITILNHAINIYRNLARIYIINSLREHFNSELKLRDALERNMNSNDDRRRLQKAAAKGRPQDGIDVGHFEYIVMNNTACFGGKRRLSTKMSEVRQVRNAAAHPEYKGIDDLNAKDGLYKVAGALKEMGNDAYGKRVEQLLPLVR